MGNYIEVVRVSKVWHEDMKISFSCNLKKGSMLGIVGQSGSGKSTVLRLLTGLIEGEVDDKILLDGKDISHLHPSKRGIGMVFQQHALFSHLRVDDNVAYGLRSVRGKKLSKKESRLHAKKMLKEFNMEDFCFRYPNSLSGGEAQRVSLARTLIVKPQLVLFDEPFSSLDAPLRKKLAIDIKEMQAKAGFTAIMVTHDISEAKQMCDAITVMKKGKQIWTGTPSSFNETIL